MFDNIHPVSISSRALEEIQRIIESKGIAADYGLRVGVRGGGCGGMSLMLGFDKRKDSDLAYQVGSVPVYVDKKHVMYLIGKEIEFVDEADARGFTFIDAPKTAQNINVSS